MSVNFGVEKVDLTEIQFTPELLRCIPAATARLYGVLPIFQACDSLGIVMRDPSKLEAIDGLAFITGRNLEIRTADTAQLTAFIEMHYPEDVR